ncbi:hypothetical protein [Paraburkholderia sp. BCC1884]|uniref:hypothetical protein n=1 Tax=Paraburkholderia sp. BCC1884 TaxID=2562668 RepID=UPI001182FD89|nr:hypothetical protein [Paraburkholderia sp. BCC1884]
MFAKINNRKSPRQVISIDTVFSESGIASVCRWRRQQTGKTRELHASMRIRAALHDRKSYWRKCIAPVENARCFRHI